MPASDPAKRAVVAIGVIGGLVGGIGAAVIGTRDNQDKPISGDLQPDGKARCVQRLFNCTGYTTQASEFRPDAGPPYASLVLAGKECMADDGGTFFEIPQPTNEVVFEPMLCTAKPGVYDGGQGVTAREVVGAEVPWCGCRGHGGALVGRCYRMAPDGGNGPPAPWGETMFPGTFTGRDCVLKVCGEVAGISSMPSNCPDRAPTGYVQEAETP